jgi:hypothetical protein
VTVTLAAVITIVVVALTVLVLAAYLIYVVLVLWRVDARLTAITAGLESINEKAAPIGPVLMEINNDLAQVDGALQAVLMKQRRPRATSRPPEPGASAPWVVAPQGRNR